MVSRHNIKDDFHPTDGLSSYRKSFWVIPDKEENVWCPVGGSAGSQALLFQKETRIFLTPVDFVPPEVLASIQASAPGQKE